MRNRTTTPGVALAIPILKPANLELAIEKSTELGASAFYIYAADHSEKKSLSENHLRRLRLITISALKQCGRLDLPPLSIYPTLQDLPLIPGTCYGDLEASAPPSPSTPLFISGPERGFSDVEIAYLREKAEGISLGPNTLRAETAPIALCAKLLI